MLLKRMKIENIRSYKSETIDFEDGVLIFQGDIGSGKSSILYSLEFVLFGGTERNFYDKIMRHEAKKASVELTFEVDDIDYTAFRSIKRRSDAIHADESYIERNGTKMELSWQDMREKIVDLLELREGARGSVDTFHMSIYTPQEEMKAILSMRDDERLESIRKIFNLEDYKRAVDNIRVVKKEIDNEITKLQTRAERIDEVKKKLEEDKEEKEEKKKERSDIKTKLKDKEEELDETEEAKNKMEKLHDKLNQLENKIERKEDTIRDLKEDIDEIKKDLDEIKEGEERLEEIKEKKESYEELAKKIDDVKEIIDERDKKERKLDALNLRLNNQKEKLEKMEKHSDKLIELEEDIEDLKPEIDKLEYKNEEKNEIQDELNEIKGDIKALNKDIQDAEDEIKEMNELEGEGKCPKCKQPITQDHIDKIIDELESKKKGFIDDKRELVERKEELKERLKELKDEIESLESKERDLEYKRKEKKRLQEEIEDLEEIKEKVENYKKDISELEDEIESYEFSKEDLEELEEKKRELRRYRDEYIGLKEKVSKKDTLVNKKKNKENRLEETKTDLKDLKSDYEEVSEEFSKEEFEEVKCKHQELLRVTSQLKERHKNIKNEIDRIEKEIKENKEDIEKMEESRKKAKKYQKLRAWMTSDFEESIKAMEESRMAQINRDFEDYFQGWFNEILDDPDITAKLDENFTPIVRVQTNETSVDDLSGGERTSVALAYRLAFNTMIKKELGLKSNLLVLDEPTTGFSREQLTRLKDVMEKITADQVIIVSHENEIANLADVEYLVDKKEGVSQVTRII
ncbi:MAG: AAA family ATPase [Thermoplasmata archaeon]